MLQPECVCARSWTSRLKRRLAHLPKLDFTLFHFIYAYSELLGQRKTAEPSLAGHSVLWLPRLLMLSLLPPFRLLLPLLPSLLLVLVLVPALALLLVLALVLVPLLV